MMPIPSCGPHTTSRFRQWWNRCADQPAGQPSTCNSGSLEAWMSLSVRVRSLICLLVMFWGLGIAIGTRSALQFEKTPGDVGAARYRWPAGSQCSLSSKHPTLVMFVHPRCGCSQASLSELSRLMNHCQGLVEAQVVFLQPRSSDPDWSQSKLWDYAHEIPGVTVRQDIDGVEHRRFNARISGELFVYQPSGELSFHGGITGGRGHTGDNPGRSTIESLLLNRASCCATAPVYGCELESQPTIDTNCSIRDEEDQ